MSDEEFKNEYKALWVQPELFNEVKNQKGRNDTERLNNWRKQDVEDLTEEDVERIIDSRVEKLVVPDARYD